MLVNSPISLKMTHNGLQVCDVADLRSENLSAETEQRYEKQNSMQPRRRQ